MPGRGLSFSARLAAWAVLLLLGYAALVAGIGHRLAQQQGQESLQRLSHGLARHIVAQWPQVTAPTRELADRQAKEALLKMLMVVNPAVQVYVLGADGEVLEYVGEPGMVRVGHVDLAPVRAFLAGAALPLLGTDPMGSGQGRLFSAAMFPPRPGDARPPGYLYVVLDGAAAQQAAAPWNTERVAWGAAQAAAAGLLLAVCVGLLSLRRLTRPLRRLAARMQAHQQELPGRSAADAGDEVAALEGAFSALTQRVQQQAEREREQAAQHRDTMAGLAHDLRTPLTALHGQLEALGAHPARLPHVLAQALAQSNKVRRLSQQLFELATLQTADELAHRERFSLDELVSDAVRKFELPDAKPRVELEGAAPGRLELEGDLHLVERALTNLIDNALRHGGAPQPVRVRLWREGSEAWVLVSDHGPGLPEEVAKRLRQGVPLRSGLPLARRHGGIGGLGLAIAQRVAQLHGGSLRPLAGGLGGAHLCLALPLAG